MSCCRSNDVREQGNPMIGEEHVKTDVAPKREPFMITCHRVFSVADSRDVTLMVIGTIGALVTGVSGLVFLYFYGKSINAVFDDPNSIDEIAIRVLITSIFTVTGGILQFSCWTMVGEILAKKLKVKFVKAILSQEIGWFDQCGRGELATIVADLSGKLKVGLGKKLGDFIENVTMITLAFAYGFYISYRLTSVMIITFVFFSSSCVYTVYTLSKAHKAILSQYASAGSVVTESLMAIRTVTALNSQCAFIEKYRKHLVSAMQIGIEVGFRVGTAMGTQNMLYFFAYSLGFWYGGDLVADSIENGCPDQADITRTNTSCITGGEVLSVFFAVTNASYAVGQLSPIMQDFANVRLAVTKMFEIIERVPMIDGFSSSGRTPSSTEIKGRIEFKDVSFSYPSRPDVQIFKNLNLNIEHGQTVAIVGPSGVGKSTCMNMILRFYDPTSGQVLLDGFSTKDVNVRWLRAQIGYVGQEPILFAGSIADNILYGLDPLIVKEAKDLMHSGDPNNLKDAKRLVKSRVVAAAKLAYAHDFIVELPKGYDTNVGSSGTQMSGGQKQRIAIARALIKRPAVLLLDEATSALDNASEKVVQKSIDALHNQKDQTTIIIAHRLSTIRKADKIAVISREGCISEEGTHKQLKALNGVYAELVRSQLSLNKDDTGNEKDRKGEVIDDDPDLDDEEDISGVLERVGTNSTMPRSGGPQQGGLRRARLLTTRRVSSILTTSKTGNADPKGSGKGDKDLPVDEHDYWSLLKRTMKVVWRHPKWLIATLAASCARGIIAPVWGLLLSMTISAFYEDDPQDIRDTSEMLSFIYIAIGVVVFTSILFQYSGVAQIGERVGMRMRSAMYTAILRREIAFFDQIENDTGEIVTRMADDSRAVSRAFGLSLTMQLKAFFTLIISLALGFAFSWEITLVSLGTFPINIYLFAVMLKGFRANSAPPPDGMSGGGLISSAFINIRTVCAFSMQNQVVSRYHQVIWRDETTPKKLLLYSGVGFGGSKSVSWLTYTLLFWFGTYLIKNDLKSSTLVIRAIFVLMIGLMGIGFSVADIGDQKLGLQAAERIFEVEDAGLNSEINGISTDGLIPTTPSRGKIEFRNVSFRYPTRKHAVVCENFNLTIEPGEVVAFAGPSGSGKSTVMNLLLRFYNPDRGEIFFDGVNIQDLNVNWLRAQIGYVGQEPVLFEGSVGDNIARGRSAVGQVQLTDLENVMRTYDKSVNLCGRKKEVESESSEESKQDPSVGTGDIELSLSPNADDDIVLAAKQSNAHGFVMGFPRNYETPVGDGSQLVSGGQKQRIAIARAIIKRPSVLLLDEATSALDSVSEKIVEESLQQLQDSRMQTTLVIAHRLTTIKDSDKIVVIDSGNVVEMGKHDELIAHNGLYAALWGKLKSEKAMLDEEKLSSDCAQQ